LKSKRHRSHEPKPFEGLTQKPHCTLCERETAHPQSPPPVPPDPTPSTNRRPREVDTSRHFCPHGHCDCRGWLGLGNLWANGHPTCVAEGLGIRATARVFEVAPNTVLQWLVEAAEQLCAFSASFLCDFYLEQLQLDEVYAVLRDCKAGEISDE